MSKLEDLHRINGGVVQAISNAQQCLSMLLSLESIDYTDEELAIIEQLGDIVQSFSVGKHATATKLLQLRDILRTNKAKTVLGTQEGNFTIGVRKFTQSYYTTPSELSFGLALDVIKDHDLVNTIFDMLPVKGMTQTKIKELGKEFNFNPSLLYKPGTQTNQIIIKLKN
jgi:hypothetical protein